MPRPSTLALLGLCGLALAGLCACADSDDTTEPPFVASTDAPWTIPDVGNVDDETFHNTGSLADAAKIVRLEEASALWFIANLDRVDHVHDAARHRLYVSTSKGSIVRYDLDAREREGEWAVGGFPLGMDLSPDGNTLLVADRSASTGRLQHFVHIIDLVSGAERAAMLPMKSSLASGTFDVAFMDDDHALVSTAGIDTGALQLLELSSQRADDLFAVHANTLLVTSADRSIIGYSSAWGTMAAFGTYAPPDPQPNQQTRSTGSTFILGMSGDARHFTLISDAGVTFMDQAFNQLSTVARPGLRPIGVAYSPATDRVCLAWKPVDGVDKGAPGIDVYDVASMQRVAWIDTTNTLSGNSESGLGTGRMKISRDGRLLFANVDRGIAIYALEPNGPAQ